MATLRLDVGMSRIPQYAVMCSHHLIMAVKQLSCVHPVQAQVWPTLLCHVAQSPRMSIKVHDTLYFGQNVTVWGTEQVSESCQTFRFPDVQEGDIIDVQS